jgi:hypothetical protein
VGLGAILKIIALILFLVDWQLVRKRQSLDKQGAPIGIGEIIGSIVSIDKCKKSVVGTLIYILPLIKSMQMLTLILVVHKTLLTQYHGKKITIFISICNPNAQQSSSLHNHSTPSCYF